MADRLVPIAGLHEGCVVIWDGEPHMIVARIDGGVVAATMKGVAADLMSCWQYGPHPKAEFSWDLPPPPHNGLKRLRDHSMVYELRVGNVFQGQRIAAIRRAWPWEYMQGTMEFEPTDGR